ncbi:hypothetical protein KY289_001327 [Solanum tuberosum]|nr:hypothetical protein KY289_001327 [Solanum tuberosum]
MRRPMGFSQLKLSFEKCICNFWGNVYPTNVALPYLRQTRGRAIVNVSVETWLPLLRMSLYSAAKAIVINFYETLRLEMKDDVGITIPTHGWIGPEITRGKFMMGWRKFTQELLNKSVDWNCEENFLSKQHETHVVGVSMCKADMNLFSEQDGTHGIDTTHARASGSSEEEFAKLIVRGACRGDAYVKYPGWYEIFLLYRVFAPPPSNGHFVCYLGIKVVREVPLLELEGSHPHLRPPPQRHRGPITMQELQKME